jgi:hypothetical protein
LRIIPSHDDCYHIAYLHNTPHKTPSPPRHPHYFYIEIWKPRCGQLISRVKLRDSKLLFQQQFTYTKDTNEYLNRNIRPSDSEPPEYIYHLSPECYFFFCALRNKIKEYLRSNIHTSCSLDFILPPHGKDSSSRRITVYSSVEPLSPEEGPNLNLIFIQYWLLRS